MHSVYGETPIFGVEYDNRKREKIKPETILKVDEIEEVDEGKENEINMKHSAYLSDFSDGHPEGKPREIVYCRELGFAMEKIKEGYTLKDLWEVVVT